MAPTLMRDMWLINAKPKDIVENFPNCFWRNVLLAWAKFCHNFPTTYYQNMGQFIWFNLYIKVDNKVVFYPKVYSAGCKFVKDMCEEEGSNLLTYVQFNEKYPGCISWLEYCGICEAIPHRWKNVIKEKRNVEQAYLHPYSIMSNTKGSKSRIVYQKLIGNELAPADSFNSWHKSYVFRAPFDLEHFSKCFVNLYKITNVTKLRDFQFRLLHKRIPSKKELCHWGIKQTNNCDYCDGLEDIKHLLYECPYIEEIWNHWVEYICIKHGVEVELSFGKVILNEFHPHPSNIVNLKGLILKQLIYRYNCCGIKLNFSAYLAEIRLCESIEMYNARKNNKVSFHQTKWETQRNNETNVNLCNFIAQYLEQM